MPKLRPIFAPLALLAVAVGAAPAEAQFGRPSAELTPVVEQSAVQPGETLTGRLRVVLDEGIHVQSDAPREEYLIPTRLTFDPPEGVTVEEVTYPPASDWFLQGQDEPLAVFESEFAIEWRLAVGPDLAPGELVVPGNFQYQSCDDRLCYPPVTAPVEWRVRVEAPRQ